MRDVDVSALPTRGDDGQLVGMISEADVARNLPDETVAEFVEEICADF